MNIQKLPIGIQTFSEIIREGYAYVDKTKYIPALVNWGKYYFLSRPRRFGKSLLLSTLRAYFEGRRELFRGLEIDCIEDVDWTPSPVLHFDLNSEDYTVAEGLPNILNRYLSQYESHYGVECKDMTLPGRFANLIRTISTTTCQGVVILIDEYDKPLLELGEDNELFKKNQALLKAFLGNLKSMDAHIRFAMLTGVARFSKVSIFSDLNNLSDISLDSEFADICGWTEQELVGKFREEISRIAIERNETFEVTLATLRNYYDGYLFAPKGSRLYNPFSLLRAFQARDIKSYWFETGTPTFLVRKVREGSINPEKLNGTQCRERDLLMVSSVSDNPVPLMFQTGYLTIRNYDKIRQRYTLCFPNKEVEIGFAEYLLPLYAPKTEEPDSPFSFYEFQDNLFDGKPEEFMQRLASMLKDLPGEDHSESVYRAVTYLICTLCSTFVQAERSSYKGRSDLEVMTPKYIYLFEFKYNRSVEEAIRQIEDRDYCGRLGMETRKVYLIGANYDETKATRGLSYTIRELEKPSTTQSKPQ